MSTPRVEEIIEPESLTCACGGGLHCIGEDVSERLDVIPAQFRVIVTRRQKYACRASTDGVTQAPAPARLIQAGLPTEAIIAHVLVSKYADRSAVASQNVVQDLLIEDVFVSDKAGYLKLIVVKIRRSLCALRQPIQQRLNMNREIPALLGAAFVDDTRQFIVAVDNRAT